MVLKGRRKRKRNERRRVGSENCRFMEQPAYKLGLEKKDHSPAGNRTPVFRVTGGDTHHYTTEDS